MHAKSNQINSNDNSQFPILISPLGLSHLLHPAYSVVWSRSPCPWPLVFPTCLPILGLVDSVLAPSRSYADLEAV